MKNNNNKKGMTVDNLAGIISRTLPTKDELNKAFNKIIKRLDKRLDKICLRIDAISRL